MNLIQSEQPPCLVYCDDDILVFDKPSGLLSVPGKDKPNCLLNQVLQLYPEALVVHRLDMSTSGLVLFARHKLAQKQFSQLFANKQILKRYLAVVAGWLTKDDGEIHLPLITDWPNRPKQKVDWENGKMAHTRWRVIQRYKLQENQYWTKIWLMPLTGKTHQLRLHMAQINHPILGDQLYASSEIIAVSSRLALHAQELSFAHPNTGKWLYIQSLMNFYDFALECSS